MGAASEQSGVISPLPANLYLHLLDRIWERHHLEEMLGARIVRYADDFVVLCKRGTERAMEIIKQVLDRLGLSLREELSPCAAIEEIHKEDKDPHHRAYP